MLTHVRAPNPKPCPQYAVQCMWYETEAGAVHLNERSYGKVGWLCIFFLWMMNDVVAYPLFYLKGLVLNLQ